tara:strand:+ start:2088 stop:2606 length:519 start_codon:yes stop_codon:yes gene_type:complete
MALAQILVGGNDHFAKGGVKSIEIAAYSAGGQNFFIGANNVATTSTLAAAGDIKKIQFKKESASIQATSSNDRGKGLYTYEIVIEGYIPNITSSELDALQKLVQETLVAKVYTWEGTNYLVGWNAITSNSSSECDHPLELTSFVLNSGSGLSDENGATATFTCIQPAPPATF